MAGRRTYTEEELQNALQDILSGKLGTRRAAVIYGIPRSTLRNKVYKLATEQKREASLLPPALDVLEHDDDEKELSGAEDDKDIEKSIAGSVLTPDMLRLAAAPSISPLSGQKFAAMCGETKEKEKLQVKPPQTPPIANNPLFDPMVLQNLVLSGLIQQKYDNPAFQEVIKNIVMKNFSGSGGGTDLLNNGKPSDSRHLMHNLSLLQQQQQHQQQQQNTPQHHHHQQQQMLHNRIMKSETPDTASSIDDANDDAVILKIPSFKPGSNSSASGKNGETLSDTQTPHTTPPMLSSSSPQGHHHHHHHMAGMSPPIMRSNNDSQSPPMIVSNKAGTLSLRDVIAKSITRTMNQQSPETIISKPSMDQIEAQYRRPSISVIKNLGGTDTTRFASSPNMMGSMSSNNTQSGSGGNNNNNGGKGTRPKRGKYRNYDRDSLIEAVKAVQRGEMSVHRAGSYYGVPHSTLEYKVKERHLMRPRKREPKPQPTDGSGAIIGNSSTNIVTINKAGQDVSGVSSSSLRSLDKTKPLTTTKPPMKTPPFPASSTNGMKMGMFDPAQLQYAQHLFWSHPPGYSAGLNIDYAAAAAAAAASGTSNSFPNNAESFFAAQMMQRIQEESMRQAGTSGSSASSKSSLAVAAAAAAAAANAANNSQSKSARDITESLYEGTSANGSSFLDGIIRHSLLDPKSSSIPHGALVDQLVKNNRHSDDGNNSNSHKRAGSPLNFAQSDIKRERSSPASSIADSDDRESINERDISKESVESLIKYRDGYSALRLDEKLRLRDSMEDLNGGGDSTDEKLNHTENEDSS